MAYGEYLSDMIALKSQTNALAIVTRHLIEWRHKFATVYPAIYEGDPRSNANASVISFKFAIIKNGLPVYYDILSILLNPITFSIYHMATPVA